MATSLALNAIAETEYDNEFWISTSTNTANLGTLDNPFDGSTATKFDTIMQNLPEYSTIHLLAGTYQTLGADGWWIKSGQKLLGSGMDVTILKLAPGAPDDDYVLNSYQSAGVEETNIEVSDMTLDCNYTSGAYTYNGIVLDGYGMAIRRVKVIHAAFFGGATSEAWGIVINGSGAIEECKVSDFAGGTNITAIDIDQGPGIIRNNRVYLSSEGAELGINYSWINNLLIDGNYVEGADGGIYSDTGGNTNIIITHNTLKNVRQGVLYAANGNVRKNVTISENTIMLTTNTPYGSGYGKVAVNLGLATTNANVTGNIVGWDGEPQPGELSADYFVSEYVQGLLVAHNRVDARLLNYFWTTNENYVAFDNYDFTGNLLTNLDQRLPSTNSFYILPPDAYVQMWNGPSITVGPQIQSLNANGFFGWNCASNSNASMFKALPLPNDFWSGRTTFVTSWNVLTTNSGSYIFSLAVCDVTTNDLSSFAQSTVTLAATTGTNITTIAATNTLLTVDPSEIGSLETLIYTGDQVQPGNYTILSGKVTAQ